MLFLVTALLHDIGHGAYSHAFEYVFKVHHESIGATIITTHPEIRNILDTIDKDFAEDVASVLLFFSSRRRQTRSLRDWSSDVCSSDLVPHHRRTRQPRQARRLPAPMSSDLPGLCEGFALPGLVNPGRTPRHLQPRHAQWGMPRARG